MRGMRPARLKGSTVLRDLFLEPQERVLPTQAVLLALCWHGHPHTPSWAGLNPCWNIDSTPTGGLQVRLLQVDKRVIYTTGQASR